MQVAFRRFPAGADSPPEPGEVYIRPDLAGQRGRRNMALLVLEQGLEALPHGEGDVERVVVSADASGATLDDMLAAAFLMRRLKTGRELPPGCRRFAEYAGLVRDGVRPSHAIAPEVSLEGVYLAIRNDAGNDLADPEVGARFLARWSRLADCILRAAEADLDPFKTSPCAEDAEFVRERAFLADDQRVYRQEVRQGERWRVRLPGDPPREGAGLLLRRPNSRLFKYWSRTDKEAPGGDGYLFMAVDFGKGSWVFSTDPVHRVPIRSLADVLQAAEAVKDGERAARDPWFDGKPFDHTLVAAPKAGTLLSEREVLRLVKRWAGVPGGWTRRRVLAAGAGAAAAAVLAPFAVLHLARSGWGDGGASLHRGVIRYTGRDDGGSGDDGQGDRQRTGPVKKGTDYALLIATNHYKEWGGLVNPVPDAQAIEKDLKDLYGFHTELVTDPTRDQILDALRRYAKKPYGDGDQLLIWIGGHGNYDPVTRMGFVVPADARADDPNGSSLLSHSELRDRVDALPCRHILLLLDVCFGGTFDAAIARGDRGGTYKEASPQEFVERKLKYMTRRYLTSGGKDFVPDGDPGKHSPFAAKFLDALRSGADRDGILTFELLTEHLEKVIPEPRGGTFGNNEAGSDFLFVRKQ